MYETYFPLISAFLCWLIAQLAKPITKYFKTGKFDLMEMAAAGGFPSSHTAAMVGLSMGLGLSSGFNTNDFFIAFVLTGIIAYDAMNVRYYAGKNIEVTKQLIEDLRVITSTPFNAPIYFDRMKNILGHERFEVFGGFMTGILITILLYLPISGWL